MKLTEEQIKELIDWDGELEWRRVVNGEQFVALGINQDGKLLAVIDKAHMVQGNRWVLIPKVEIEVPSFIKPGWWIARDEDGEWWTFDQEPERGISNWASMECQSAELSGFINHGLEKYDHIFWKKTKAQQKGD